MQKSHTCQHCGDPATIIETFRKPYWPFEIERTDARCYECHQEVIYNRLPKLTDPQHRSRRGSGMGKRKRLME